VDALNTLTLFDSADSLGIPLIPKETRTPDVLISHKTRLNHQLSLGDEQFSLAVHFFMEDYRFEPVWSTPRKGASYVGGVGWALSPDFSLYRAWPLTVQLWNVYRNRWCGAYWRSLGVRVLPTVSWSDEASYSFCFLGVEKGSAVAISSVGVDLANAEERELFATGCRAMVETIEPEAVLLQAEVFPEDLVGECDLDTVDLRKYPPRWKSIRQARKEAGSKRTDDY
jgi:hypothetical protein